MSNSFYNNSTTLTPFTKARAESVESKFDLVTAGFTLAEAAINLKGTIAGQTWSGAHDFSGGSIRVPTQTVGESSTNAASTAFVAATSFAAALPGQTGSAGKFLTSDGAAASWVSPIPVASGGTGFTSYTIGDITYASGATALFKLAGVATGNALISGGVATAPAWGKVGLTTHISGILGAANGGTGVANNAANTVTFSGNFGLTLTLTGASSITLPTTGVVVTESGAATLTNKTISGFSNTISTLLARSARTSNTILAVADVGTLIDITSGTFTQTLTAAATLGAGWWCYIRNSGTGDITLDPNGAETIDGLASYLMYPGEARLVQCDGAAFTTVVVSPFVKRFTSTGTFTKPPGYSLLDVLVQGPGGGGGSGARSDTTGGNNSGGAGGGGGALAQAQMLSSSITATVAATVGAAGTAGAAVTVNDTAGNAGGSGGTSSFGAYLDAAGGDGGGGGQINSNTGSASGGGSAGPLVVAGTSGGQGISQAAGGVGIDATVTWGATGGGGGGGILTGSVANNGGVGGASGTSSSATQHAGGVAGLTAGTRPGGVGQTGSRRGGTGGGGGASLIGAAGAAGGAGGVGGGGGGGGSSSQNTFNSGAGAVGGAGYVEIGGIV